jgi:hypothetical protein
MGGFGTLLDKLHEIFGKGFALAGFLPVTVFFLLNASIASIAFPVALPVLTAFLERSLVDQISVGFLLLLVIALFGFILWSLNPFFRQTFEGRHLPEWLRKRMIAAESFQARRLRTILDEMRRDVANYREQGIKRKWLTELVEARQAGIERPLRRPLADLSSDFRPFRDAVVRADIIKFQDIELLFRTLRAELRAQSARANPALAEWHREFIEILEWARTRLDNEYRRKQAALLGYFPRELGIEPTVVGNISELHRDYGLTRYEFDTEVFWLHLQKLIKGDEKFWSILESARLQLDFSVSMTVVMLMSTVLWMALTMFIVPSLAIYCGAVGFCWVFTGITHAVMTQNYFAYSITVKAAIDLFRFDLLTALHFGHPKTLEEERELWPRVMSALDPSMPYVEARDA